MINELTKEQEDSFPYFVDKWTKINTATGPTNVEKVRDIIYGIYTANKLPLPKYFFHYENPLDMLNGRVICSLLNDYKPGRKYTPTKTVDPEFLASYEATYKMLTEQVNISAHHPGYTWNDTIKLEILEHCLKSFNSKSLIERRKALESSTMYGNHEAHNLAHKDFWYHWFKFDFLKDLEPFFALAEEVGWWAAEAEIVYISDRPQKLFFNNDMKLHNTNGPAMEYGNEFKIYAITHNDETCTVPAFIVENPETITPETIKGISSNTLKEIYIMQYGYEKYAQALEMTSL